MPSPYDIPKIQSNINSIQSKTTESIPADKDRKENPQNQSQNNKEKEEKDSIILSSEVQKKFNIKKTNEQDFNEISNKKKQDEPGKNIDIKI